MATKTEPTTPQTDENKETADTNGVPATELTPVPVIYEEVELTEGAAAILERLARENAESKQPARKPRSVPLGDPSSLPS
jgi:hypothetical protein